MSLQPNTSSVYFYVYRNLGGWELSSSGTLLMSTLQARNAEEGDNRISFYSAFLIPLSRGTAAVTWCLGGYELAVWGSCRARCGGNRATWHFEYTRRDSRLLCHQLSALSKTVLSPVRDFPLNVQKTFPADESLMELFRTSVAQWSRILPSSCCCKHVVFFILLSSFSLIRLINNVLQYFNKLLHFTTR